MNAIAKILRASPSTILRWIRHFGIQHAHPPEPQTDAVVLELDEMWHYLKKKQKLPHTLIAMGTPDMASFVS